MSKKRSEYKQPFFSTNDEKNERHPVVFYGVFQHVQEAQQIRDEWRQAHDAEKYTVRVYERQIRVDTIATSAFIAVVRRRAA
jgi:hypothetical protein